MHVQLALDYCKAFNHLVISYNIIIVVVGDSTNGFFFCKARELVPSLGICFQYQSLGMEYGNTPVKRRRPHLQLSLNASCTHVCVRIHKTQEFCYFKNIRKLLDHQIVFI